MRRRSWGLAWRVTLALPAGPACGQLRRLGGRHGGARRNGGARQSSALTLPTYEEGLPDVNPRFDLFARRPFLIYPYTARTNLTDRRADRTWRTLELENEHLKLVVLPDLGGRIYSCVDKATGAEMFYANPSIKFADVAYRGAWVALGVEFNFPVSHNWATVSPVDFGTVRHEDGSASVWVGNDRPPVRDAVAGRADAPPGPLAPRADDDALQPQRRAPPLLLVDDGLGPRRRRLAHPLPDGVLGVPPLRRRRHLAGGLLRARPQLPPQPPRGLRVALRPRQPRAVHGRLPPHDRVGDGARGRSPRHAGQEDLVLGLGRRGEGLAPGALRRPERVPRGPGRPLPEPGDLRVPRAPAAPAVPRDLPAGAEDRRLVPRERRRRRPRAARRGQRTAGRPQRDAGRPRRPRRRPRRRGDRPRGRADPRALRRLRSTPTPTSRRPGRTPSRSATGRAACSSPTPRAGTTSCRRPR